MEIFNIISLDKIDSTNDYLKKNYESLPSFSIIRTDFQTNGRGQFDRTWISLKGKNLIFSLLLKNIHFNQLMPIKEWIKSSLFSLLGSFGLDVYFKEPNDIYVNDKKLCGILIETMSSQNIFEYVIVGVGLNVNQKSFNNLKATSIALEKKKQVNIHDVFDRLKNILKENYF